MVLTAITITVILFSDGDLLTARTTTMAVMVGTVITAMPTTIVVAADAITGSRFLISGKIYHF